jgi:NADH:ubiquinone oxidoreductase subunit 2 (subunit N)
VVSAGYYLPVIMAMYMKPADDPAVAERAGLVGGTRAVVAVVTVALLLFGVWPNRLIDLARQSGADLRSPAGLIISQDQR